MFLSTSDIFTKHQLYFNGLFKNYLHLEFMLVDDWHVDFWIIIDYYHSLWMNIVDYQDYHVIINVEYTLTFIPYREVHYYLKMIKTIKYWYLIDYLNAYKTWKESYSVEEVYEIKKQRRLRCPSSGTRDKESYTVHYLLFV